MNIGDTESGPRKMGFGTGSLVAWYAKRTPP